MDGRRWTDPSGLRAQTQAIARGAEPLRFRAMAPPEAAPEPSEVARLVEELSPRRLEVLQLIAKGLTNREIAGVLGISVYTVKAHVAHVLGLLDLTNRTEAAVALHEYEAAVSAIAE